MAELIGIQQHQTNIRQPASFRFEFIRTLIGYKVRRGIERFEKADFLARVLFDCFGFDFVWSAHDLRFQTLNHLTPAWRSARPR